jgi:hypothetical protein
MNFRANMASLRTLSDDYSYNRISFAEYRQQRSNLLKLIDEDLNGVQAIEVENEMPEKNDQSIINKALSFLKIDKLKEIN